MVGESLPRRVHSRDELAEVELSESREAGCRELYDEFREKGGVAVRPVEAYTSCSASLMESLHRDRVFPYISSFMDADASARDRMASAKVRDPRTGARLRADAWRDELVVTAGSDGVPFESFRDYLVFLQISLHTEFEAVE